MREKLDIATLRAKRADFFLHFSNFYPPPPIRKMDRCRCLPPLTRYARYATAEHRDVSDPPPPPPFGTCATLDAGGAPKTFEAGGGPKKKQCCAPPPPLLKSWIRPCIDDCDQIDTLRVLSGE